MDQIPRKQAYAARSANVFGYSGNAEVGLSIDLESGGSLFIRPQQVRDIIARFSRFNPLLDDTKGNVFCPTARFESWIEKDARSFFSRRLSEDAAMRILGAFYNEGLIEKHFRHAADDDAGPCEIDPIVLLGECTGRLAVYREKGYYGLVRVIRVFEEDDGVSLDLQVIKSPGFCTELSGKFTVGSSFEYLSISQGYAVTSMVSWMLVTHPLMVERLIELAAACPERDEFIDGLYAITRFR